MILITGGAGYIGSHVNKLLNHKGFKTVIFDNLSRGNIKSVKWGEFVLGDLSDVNQIRLLFKNFKIRAVIHFAAYAYVGESVKNPEKYYFNNLVNTLNLLKVMNEFNCSNIIFSSTCSTYGIPEKLPITETHAQSPINPYGKSKLAIEKVLEDFSIAYGLKYISLRYFNAAGADIDCEIGEIHNPEPHLIPRILDTALGINDYIEVFGTDYNTKDGSCVRDYIHVTDLASAHYLALKYLLSEQKSDFFNIGNEKGISVLEVIDYAKKITGKDFKVKFSDRRKGDPPVLVADSTKIKSVLGWRSNYHKLEDILTTAWKWHLKLKKGV